MNNQRRKGLNDIKVNYIALCRELNALGERFEALKEDLEGMRDAEQEAFDNMPESLQGGAGGEASEAAISAMEDAITLIESITEFTESNDVSEFETAIDTAKE